MNANAGLIVVAVVVLLILVVVSRAIRIVSQARAGVVERLGRYSRTLNAGLHVLVPFLDHVKATVDLREQVIPFPPAPVITEDNVTISIDTVFYYQVTDPVRATYEVANLLQAVEQLTVTTLRNVIGSLSLEETLTSRDKINADLRVVLDEATERWGLRVNRIELKSIDPPLSIQEAMEKQMRAERDKRASILIAEAEKQANVLQAEGEKQARILRAEGDAEAVRSVFKAIHEGDPSPDLLAYKYLETLPAIANGQATKLLMVPSDAVNTLGVAAALGAAFQSGQALDTPADSKESK